MNRHRDPLWSAYLDGELTAAEASEFDARLNAEERERMAAEVRLESGIAERLAASEKCPDALWKRIEQGVTDASDRQNQPRRSFVSWALPSLAAAAGILLALALFVPSGPNQVPAFLHLAAANEPMAQNMSEVDDSVSHVQDFLRQVGMQLALTPETQTHSRHHIHLIGARKEMFEGKPYVRLFYQCCKTPVEVIVARQGDPAAKAIISAHEHHELQNSRMIGDYIVTVLGGPHHTPEVLGLVKEE